MNINILYVLSDDNFIQWKPYSGYWFNFKTGRYLVNNERFTSFYKKDGKWYYIKIDGNHNVFIDQTAINDFYEKYKTKIKD